MVVLAIAAQLPFLARGVSTYDEGSILAIADGIRRGGLLYEDIVTPKAPLTYETLALLYRLFGPHVLTGRLLQALLFTLTVLVLHAILLKVAPRRWAMCGTLAVLAVKALGFPLWTIANYSQMAFLFAVASVLALLHFLPQRQATWLVWSGAGAGLTLISKQNVAVYLGAALALTVIVDWWTEANRRIAVLLRRGASLFAGFAVPVLAAGAFYAARGALPALLDRAVWRLQQFVEPYYVGLPGPGPWSGDTQRLGTAFFTYLPTPLLQLAWQGKIDLFSRGTALSLELAVKVVYYLPLLFVAAGFWIAARDRRLTGAQRSGLVLLASFAATSYASMLYRADWTHLMNVYPALLAVAVAVLHRWARAVRWRAALCVGLFVAWMAAGAGCAAAVFAVYRFPVDTPRGRLLVEEKDAARLEAVLEHVASRPLEERILFLRSDPLFYFLTGRPVPIRFDLVMPGIVADARDDSEIADAVASVERVIFNPKVVPTVPSPLVEYAPLTARVLAGRFRVAAVLAANAVVLERDPGREHAAGELDLWREASDEASGTPASVRLHREGWLAYRVLATPGGNDTACAEVPLKEERRRVFSAIPVFHPDLWSASWPEGETPRGTFEVGAIEPGRQARTVKRVELVAGVPGDRWRVDLAALAPDATRFRFCASMQGSVPFTLQGKVGWAEPVLRER